MKAKLKLDENLGKAAADILRRAGHDVSTIVEQKLCSTSDKQVIAVCNKESRCLVTLDLDFSNTLVFNPADYAGIAVLRLPPNPSLMDLHQAIRTLVAGLAQTDISGKLWIVRHKRIREYQAEA